MCKIGSMIYGDEELPSESDLEKSFRSINLEQGTSYNYLNKNLEDMLFKNMHQKCNYLFASFSGKVELKITSQRSLIQEFFKVLSVCHECVAEQVDEKITFQGQSPDEIALVEFAQQHGFEFVESNDEVIRLNRNIRVDEVWQFREDL